MQKIREWAKGLVFINFLWQFAWLIALVLITAIGVVVAVNQGDFGQLPHLLLVLFGLAGVWAFIGWVSRDARRAAGELRRPTPEQPATPDNDDDMSDVAGGPRNPPWMG